MTESWQITGLFDFAVFDRLLQALGWRRDSDALPVDPGEPTFASWARDPDGQLEYVHNKALDVQALAVRGEDTATYLMELSVVVPLSPSPLTLLQWEKAGLKDARTTALVMAETIKVQVMPLLAALRHDQSGEMVRQLVPRPEDYAVVFVEEVASAAQAAYERLWSGAAGLWRRPAPQQRDILCYVAPAGMLAYDNELSRPFPGGYRAIADKLEPSRVWVAWKYVEPGTLSGLAFNGLVWINGHWAWFPKPYQVLRRFLPE